MLYNSPQRKYDLHLIPSVRSNMEHDLQMGVASALITTSRSATATSTFSLSGLQSLFWGQLGVGMNRKTAIYTPDTACMFCTYRS